MSNIELQPSIDSACADLTYVTTALARVGSGSTLPSSSKNFFDQAVQFTGQLKQVGYLLPLRSVALKALKEFPSTQFPKSPDTFSFGGGPVSFKDGRYLLLQNYLVTSWAVYDSLMKIAGVLCCTDEIVKSKAKPIKLFEDVIRGKNSVGSRMQTHIKEGYGWPMAVSYKLRNWVAHDGHNRDSVDLFKWDDFQRGREFEVSDEAWKKLHELCAIDPTFTRVRKFPEIQKDLVIALEVCHREVDEAMSILLRWAKGAVRLQAQLLLSRDPVL